MSSQQNSFLLHNYYYNRDCVLYLYIVLKFMKLRTFRGNYVQLQLNDIKFAISETIWK